MAFQKTECPISRVHFSQHAKPIVASVGGKTVELDPRNFSTGSFGYYANGKVKLVVGGTEVTFQVGITLTAVGSKELPQVNGQLATAAAG